MIKFSLLLLMLFGSILPAQTQSFTLKARFENIKNTTAFLTYSQGWGLLIQDSLAIDEAGQLNATLKDILPGLYTLAVRLDAQNNLLKDLLLDKDTLIDFTIDAQNNIRFIAGADNQHFYKIALQLRQKSKAVDSLKQLRASRMAAPNANTKKKKNKKIASETQADITGKITRAEAALLQLIRDYQQKHPRRMFALMNSLIQQDLSPRHPLNTAADTLRYRYFLKNNYFNPSVDWSDNRLRRTAVLYDYISNYLNNIVEINTDSLNAYTDRFLSLVYEKNPLLFQDIAYYLYMKYVRYNPFLGADGVFYHTYKKFIEKDASAAAFTSRGTELKNLGNQLARNQIGMGAPDLRLEELYTKKVYTQKEMTDPDASYYLLCFWDPYCHHCRIALPFIDSVMYGAPALAEKYKVKLFSITLDGDQGLASFTKAKHFHNNWTYLFETPALRQETAQLGADNFRISYALIQTPTFYLLDKHKKIVAKNMSYKQIEKVLSYLHSKPYSE